MGEHLPYSGSWFLVTMDFEKWNPHSRCTSMIQKDLFYASLAVELPLLQYSLLRRSLRFVVRGPTFVTRRPKSDSHRSSTDNRRHMRNLCTEYLSGKDCTGPANRLAHFFVLIPKSCGKF